MNAVTIIEFKEAYTEDFYRLNVEWLEKYFYVEEYDREVLSKPKEYILDKGGIILFALVKEQVAGTVSLINRNEAGYELSKMAVTEKFQGLRIGKKLMYAAIYKTIALGSNRIFLDSNTILKPAINLYNKVGFREIPVPEDSPYERCNIRMEIKL